MNSFLSYSNALSEWINKYKISLFILLVVLMSFGYNYQQIMFYKPQAIHVWRQADCNSIVKNYSHHGLHFFKPELFSQISDGFTSGYNVSEFPIIYYLAAVIDHNFIESDSILRIINTIIFLLALIYLFKLAFLFTSDFFWSACIGLLLFTPQVLVYYGCNYLNEISSLSFAVIGWYYFFKNFQKPKIRTLILSVLLFTLSALLKISSLSHLGISALILIYHHLWIKKPDKPEQKLIIYSILYFISFILILSWYFFAKNYNIQHQTAYFLYGLWPIWDVTRGGEAPQTLHAVWERFRQWTIPNLIDQSVLYLSLAGLILLLLFNWKKSDKVLLILSILFTANLICFILLFFGALGHHNYYLITSLIPPIIFIFIGLVIYLNRILNNSVLKITVKLIFAAYILILYMRTQDYMKNSAYKEQNSFKESIEDFYTIEPYLRTIGIKRDDKVINIPDYTSNLTLSLTNQQGWTDYIKTIDSAAVSYLMQFGPKYILIDKAFLYNRPSLKYYLTNCIGVYNHIFIYALPDNKTCGVNRINYDIKKVTEINCDMETLIKNRFATNLEKIIIGNGDAQSGENYFSGRNSLKINPKEYNMNLYFTNVMQNNSFSIELKKTGSSGYGYFILSSANPNDFYFGTTTINSKLNSEWNQMKTVVKINTKLPDNKLIFYLWNNSNDSVCYFDDLRIKWFKN